MKIIPIGDKVVVKRLEQKEMTAGGIVLPDTARERPAEGRVVSVGDGLPLADGSLAEFQVAEGDRVLFNSYAGAEVALEGEEFLVMHESDILAVVG